MSPMLVLQCSFFLSSLLLMHCFCFISHIQYIIPLLASIRVCSRENPGFQVIFLFILNLELGLRVCSTELIAILTGFKVQSLRLPKPFVTILGLEKPLCGPHHSFMQILCKRFISFL